MELKEKLVELRRQKGLTQDELARALRVTRQAISKWERGVAVPSMENLVYIGRLYGIPLDELVNGEQQREEPPATAVAVAEKPEADEKRGKPNPLRLAGATALAGCLLLTGIAIGIIFGVSVLQEPESPEKGPTIISQQDMEWEDIDLTKVINLPEENSGIIFAKSDKE